jgi:hypothetical protein
VRHQSLNILDLLFLFILFFSAKGAGQTYIPESHRQTDSLIIVHKIPFLYRFPDTHRPLIQTLTIYKNSRLLVEDADYRLQQKEEAVKFFPPPEVGDTLRIIYRRQPYNLKKTYQIFSADTLNGDSLTARKAIRFKKIDFKNPFTNLGSNLQTSGSLMRGVKIGSNQNMSLNSGINLELSGKISDNVEIIAALTDETTPIQPEGNTKSLEEVDNVFVQFKSPYVRGTVGDFNLKYSESEFINVSRKLQGISVLGNYKGNSIGGTVATSRGFFNHLSFIGKEGNQGPYQLTGKNGERDIVVLAGTEKVWVNGIAMIRGQNNDYVIEYGNGQITFSINRLITSESRIEVDFEYFPASQKYSRTAIGAVAGTRLSDDKLKIDFTYYREADDPEKSIGLSGAIGPEEKEIIKNAGNDPLHAYIGGAVYVGDSLGNYIRVDSLINGEIDTIYIFKGIRSGDYLVSFGFVGKAQGDYIRERIGSYRYVGKKRGDYLPVRLLPLPSKQEMGDVRIDWAPSQYININSEMAISSLDQNTLSDIGDTLNQGGAFKLNASLNNMPLSFGAANLGFLQFNMNARYIDNDFKSLDRLNRPDYNRYWDILQAVQNSSEEQSVQLNGKYTPIPTLNIAGNWGALKKSSFASNRSSAQLDFKDPAIMNISANYGYTGSDLNNGEIKGNWWKTGLLMDKDIWKLQPQLSYKREHRKNYERSEIKGFQFDIYNAKMSLINLDHFFGNAEYTKRNDAVYIPQYNNSLTPQAESATKSIKFGIRNYSSTSATINFLQRDKNYSQTFKGVGSDSIKLYLVDPTYQDTVWRDGKTNLAELNISHNRWKKSIDLSWQYRVSTQQTALKEKVYVEVAPGFGYYRYDEELGEYVPDPDGNYVLYVLPSDRFEPVTNFQSSLRFKFDPQRYWKKINSGWGKYLTQISGETFFRVEEETKERDLFSIYLLNLSKFQGDSTLLGVISLNQDIYFMRRNRKISFRLRYRYLDELRNQYLDAADNEKRYTRELGIRADWRVNTKLRSRSELSRKTLIRDVSASVSRSRDIYGYYVNQDFSFRPVRSWEFGLVDEFGLEKNSTAYYPISLWYNTIRGRVNYSLTVKTRITGNYEYQLVNPYDNPLNKTIPYEMARGKKEGVSQFWQMRVEYNVAKNIMFSLFYSGRDDAAYKHIIHTGNAEIRAFF